MQCLRLTLRRCSATTEAHGFPCGCITWARLRKHRHAPTTDRNVPLEWSAKWPLWRVGQKIRSGRTSADTRYIRHEMPWDPCNSVRWRQRIGKRPRRCRWARPIARGKRRFLNVDAGPTRQWWRSATELSLGVQARATALVAILSVIARWRGQQMVGSFILICLPDAIRSAFDAGRRQLRLTRSSGAFAVRAQLTGYGCSTLIQAAGAAISLAPQ